MSGEPKRIAIGVFLTLVFVLSGLVPVPPCAPAVCGASCDATAATAATDAPSPESHACCDEEADRSGSGSFQMSAATRACTCGLEAPMPAAGIPSSDVRLPLPAPLVAELAIEVVKEPATEARSPLTEQSPHRRSRPVFLEIASLLI